MNIRNHKLKSLDFLSIIITLFKIIDIILNYWIHNSFKNRIL